MVIGMDSNIFQYNEAKDLSDSTITVSKEQKKNYIDKVQFQLTKNNGFLIKLGDNILCTKGSVTQIEDSPLILDQIYDKNNNGDYQNH